MSSVTSGASPRGQARALSMLAVMAAVAAPAACLPGEERVAGDEPHASAEAAASGLGALNDDFSGSALDPSWSNLMPALVNIGVNGGAAHLQAVPGQDAVWFGTSTRTLIYKLVSSTGFKVTTTVHPRKRTNLTQAPTHNLHVGGLMVRDPASHGGSTENYLFIMQGSNESANPGVEVKSTTNSNSVFSEPLWSNPLASDLRICRLGAAFHVYKRVPGTTTWQTGQSDLGHTDPTENRPDLPATLQVGMALNYSGVDNDLDVAFDSITFEPASTLADCTSDAPATPPVPAASRLLVAALAAVMLGAGAGALSRTRQHRRVG